MFRIILSVAAIGLAACETLPPTYDPVLFASEVEAINTNPSIVAKDRELSRILAREDLTIEQRASSLFLRGQSRFEGRFNLPGAIEDFNAFSLLVPDDPRTATIARHEVFAATEIENAQRRLAQLQTLSAWFDDKVLMGDLEAAALRYKSSGLTPTDQQLYLLKEAGYVCVGDGAGVPVHQFGELPDYATNLVWCAPADLS
jgi:hypothetical protein